MTTAHAIVRAAERYGLTLTIADLDQMMLDITSAKLGEPSTALLGGLQTDGKERWFVQAKGVALRVIYSPHDARVITILSLGGTLEPRWMSHRQKQRGRGRRERAEDWRAEA